MKKIRMFLTIWLCINAIVYGSVSLVALDLNITNWSEAERVFYALFPICVGALVSAMVSFVDWENTKL